jgi:hypothetical protein
MRFYLALSPLFMFGAGCGDDPVSVSDVVDLKLSVSSGDVQNGMLLDEKNVNTESGNPYGVFVQSARDEIGGEPSRITVDGAAVSIDPSSNNVTTVGAVFLGATKIEFVMNGSTTHYAVATRDVLAADGGGPVEFTVDFDSDDIPAADFTDLASGSFKVAISGPPAASFPGANADANLKISLTFSAFE